MKPEVLLAASMQEQEPGRFFYNEDVSQQE